MKQTTKINKVMKPKFRADLVKKYIKENGLNYEKFYNLLVEEQELDIYIENSTFRQYFTGAIQDISIDVLKAMANQIGVTLDYFCYNDNVNAIEKQIQNKWGLSNETINLLIQYKPTKTILTTDSKPKDVVKKDYNAILNLLLEKKIQLDTGRKTFIELFNAKVLNLLICSIVYDTRFMQNFKENFDKLSLEINKNKTLPIGNTDIDFIFQEIIKSPKIKEMIIDSKNELHKVIDELLENTLKETFDSIKPITTLF